LLRASKQSKSKTRYIPFNSLRFALKNIPFDSSVSISTFLSVSHVHVHYEHGTWNMTMPMTMAMTLTMPDHDHGHDHIHIGFPRNEIFLRKEMAYRIGDLFCRNEMAKKYISPNYRTKQINYLTP
jgi:hypothetical protein